MEEAKSNWEALAEASLLPKKDELERKESEKPTKRRKKKKARKEKGNEENREK